MIYKIRIYLQLNLKDKPVTPTNIKYKVHFSIYTNYALRVGTCESADCVPIKSRIESGVCILYH